MKSRYLNMDLVRYVLSVAVIIAHFNQMFGAHIPYPITSGTAVGIFFGISGYLVYGSFLKHPDLGKYISSRAKRILPPYLFIIIVCAFGLSTVSTLSLSDYFTDAGLYKYIAANICFLNFLHPSLPGVFTECSINAVNASLWTLKIEWALYLSIPLFFWGVRRYRWHVPTAVIIICLFSFAYTYIMALLSDVYGNPVYYKLSYQFIGQLTYFYTGVLVYHYRDRVTGRSWLPMLLLAAVVFAITEDDIFDAGLASFHYLNPIILVFVTLLFSLSKSISHHTSVLGNVSYEMYLFHFPIIQLAVHLHIDRYASQYVCCLILLTIIILFSLSFQKGFDYLSDGKKILYGDKYPNES